MERRTVFLAFVVLCLSADPSAQVHLVAPVYPGAEPLRIKPGDEWRSGGIVVNGRQTTFLSAAEPEQIVAFYALRVRTMHFNDSMDTYFFETDRSTAAASSGRTSGVRVFSRGKERVGDIEGFADLRALVKAGVHRQDEFDAAYAQYKYLNRAYFNLTDAKDNRGTLVDVQQELYRRCEEYLWSGRNGDPDQSKAGRPGADGVAHIFAVNQEGHPGLDAWGTWIQYFETLRKHAFRTLIIIDHAAGDPQPDERSARLFPPSSGGKH